MIRPDYGDDIPFAVVDSTAARLWQPDIGLLNYAKRAHTLLARDGTRPVQIIQSVRVPGGARMTPWIALPTTITANVRVWWALMRYALRLESTRRPRTT